MYARYRYQHRRRYFNGLLLLLILKAFGRTKGRNSVTPTQKTSLLKVLIVTLIFVLVVLPAVAMITAGISQARWRADHPVLTIVPDVKGFNPKDAETTVRAAQLESQVFTTLIDSRCWATPPRVGTIIYQTPEAGIPVPPGTLVRLELAVENQNRISKQDNR